MDKDAFAAARAALGITQAVLARHLGVYQPTVARWETGVMPIPGPVEACLDLMAKVPRKKWPTPAGRPKRETVELPEPEQVLLAGYAADRAKTELKPDLDEQVQATLRKLRQMEGTDHE